MFNVKLLLLLLLCSFSSFALDDEPELDDDGNPIANANMAPEWQIKNRKISLSSEVLKGKPYVLHFWATWCPYCKRLQPGLETIAQGYINKGIDTYAVSFWENPRAKPTKEMQSRELNFKVLERGDEVAKLFNVSSTPTTVFVNHRGEISFTYLLSDPNDPQLRLAYETLVKAKKDDERKAKEKREAEALAEQEAKNN